uniref:S-layer homology domain-containing protein n=1 Tax=Candidatus Electronema sp. TaxID=2698783 RepID=UPI0040566E19
MYFRVIFLSAFVFLSISENSYSADCGDFIDADDYKGEYCKDVDSLKSQGLINGYDDGTFRYGDTLSRREMMKMVVLAKVKREKVQEYKKEILINGGENKCFADVDINEDLSDYICYAKDKLKIIGGYKNEDGSYSYKPNQKVSYGEASKMILLSLSENRRCWKDYKNDSLVNYVEYMNSISGNDDIKDSADVKRDLYAHMLRSAIDAKKQIENCKPTPASPSVVVMDLDNEPLRQIFWKPVSEDTTTVYRVWRKDPKSASVKQIYCENGDILGNKYSYIDNDVDLKEDVKYEYSIQAGNSKNFCSDQYEDYRNWSYHSNPTILHNNQKKLILVDGLHPLRTGLCQHKDNFCPPTDWDDYLGKGYNRTRVYLVDQLFHNNQNILTLRDLKDYDIYAFRWSGDVISGEPDIPFLDLDIENEDKGSEGLKLKFNNWMNNYVINVSPKKPTVSFLAYSWGTVITTDFIASLPDDKININILLTIGCPVTGANIKWSEKPFWEVAGDRLKDEYQAKWINIVKGDDVVAWDVPDTDNFISVGFNSKSSFCQKSKKNRLPELFPVSDSAMEMKYLNNTLVKAGFYGGVSFGQLIFLQLLVNTGNLDDYIDKTGKYWTKASIEEIGESIFEHHLICPHGEDKCGYHPDQIIKFILNKLYCQ